MSRCPLHINNFPLFISTKYYKYYIILISTSDLDYMCSLLYHNKSLIMYMYVEIANNLPDQHIWHYKHLQLYDCYYGFYVFYSTCIYM